MENLVSTLTDDARLLSKPLAIRPGGGAINAALASRNLNMGARVFACFGDDERGNSMLKVLCDYGIECFGCRSTKPTGVFLSLGMDHELKGSREIIVSPGAARDIRGCEAYDGLFVQDWYLLIDGLLIDSPEWLNRIAAKALDEGMKIALDASTVFTVRRHGARLLDFVKDYCDYFFLNEAEYRALKDGQNLLNIENTPVQGKAKILIKQGKRGAMALSGDRRIEVSTVPIDTDLDIGAGDVFAAGFLKAQMEGSNLEKALEEANEVAGDYLRSHRGIVMAP
jgi:sugar/nucleoside kinase (ribokinase family)